VFVLVSDALFPWSGGGLWARGAGVRAREPHPEEAAAADGGGEGEGRRRAVHPDGAQARAAVGGGILTIL